MDSEQKAKRYADRTCVKCGGVMEPINIVSSGGANMPMMKYVCYECNNCHSMLYTPKRLVQKK